MSDATTPQADGTRSPALAFVALGLGVAALILQLRNGWFLSGRRQLTSWLEGHSEALPLGEFSGLRGIAYELNPGHWFDGIGFPGPWYVLLIFGAALICGFIALERATVVARAPFAWELAALGVAGLCLVLAGGQVLALTAGGAAVWLVCLRPKAGGNAAPPTRPRGTRVEGVLGVLAFPLAVVPFAFVVTSFFRGGFYAVRHYGWPEGYRVRTGGGMSYHLNPLNWLNQYPYVFPSWWVLLLLAAAIFSGFVCLIGVRRGRATRRGLATAGLIVSGATLVLYGAGLLGFALVVVAIVTSVSAGRVSAPAGSRAPGATSAEVRVDEVDIQQRRIEAMRQWQEVYRQTHDGAEAPPEFLAHMLAADPAQALRVGGSPSVAAGGTNTMALLALIFGLLTGPIAIIFGHIGLSQIRRTREGGRGMAIAGLVLGYFWLLVVIAYFVLVAVVLKESNDHYYGY